MSCRSLWMPLVLVAAGLVVMTATACREDVAAPAADGGPSNGAASERSAAVDAPAPLEPADLGSAQPAHRVGDLYLAGQPSVADIARWARKGYNTIVNLREPDEIEWDEGREVRVAGMHYISIPVGSAEDFTDDVFDEVRKLLGDPARRPLVLHCATSNRVGAAWMTYRVLDEGVPVREAVAEAARAGLTSAAYSQKARDYIRQRQESR